MTYRDVLNRPMFVDCHCVQLRTRNGATIRTEDPCRRCYGIGVTPFPYWEVITRMHALEKDKKVRQLLIDIVNKEVAEGFDRAKQRAEFADKLENLRKQSTQQGTLPVGEVSSK